jgi:hypothetical protein
MKSKSKIIRSVNVLILFLPLLVSVSVQFEIYFHSLAFGFLAVIAQMMIIMNVERGWAREKAVVA